MLTDVDTLVVVDVDTLELNGVDVETLVLALGKIKDSVIFLGAEVLSATTCFRGQWNYLRHSYVILSCACTCFEFFFSSELFPDQS